MKKLAKWSYQTFDRKNREPNIALSVFVLVTAVLLLFSWQATKSML